MTCAWCPKESACSCCSRCGGYKGALRPGKEWFACNCQDAKPVATTEVQQ